MKYESKLSRHRKYRRRLDFYSGVGGLIGLAAGTVATVWGGYELGTLINDAAGLEGYLSRGGVDIATMAVLAGPVLKVGELSGSTVGSMVGLGVNLSEDVMNVASAYSKRIGDVVSENYAKIKDKYSNRV